jgi:hypothetical protein
MSFDPHKHRDFDENANEVCDAKEIYRRKWDLRDSQASKRVVPSSLVLA